MDAKSRRNLEIWASTLTDEELEDALALLESPEVQQLIAEEEAKGDERAKPFVDGIELHH